MGERADTQRAEGERELDAMAGRLASLFATLNDYPSIRWVRGGVGVGLGLGSGVGSSGWGLGVGWG